MRTLFNYTFSTLPVLILLALPAWAACPKGDLNGDCQVDHKDLKIVADQWLSPPGASADLDGLNGVEQRDLAMVAGSWKQKGIPLVINEFMASNSGGNLDPQGQDDDWIEIYNAGNEPINIAGMHLTDNLDQPGKWQIPTNASSLTTIQPADYLIIWADIDTEDHPDGLHANFQIGAGNGQLGLFDSNTAILIDKVKFPDQTPNISYGRYPDANDTWQFFGVPTHDSTNTGAYLGQVADTKFSHNRGFYDTPFYVTLATDTNDAQIYYTTDGSSPIDIAGQFPIGTPYTSHIRIETTTCLRAIAFKPGYKPTNADAQTYIFLEDVITQDGTGLPNTWGSGGADYEMDPDVVDHANYSYTIKDDLKAVPTMSLNMPINDWFGSDSDVETGGIYSHPQWEDQYGPEAERAVSVEYFDPATDEQFQINALVRIAGGSSTNPWKMEKLSMRLKFSGRVGPAKLNFPIFGKEAANRFNSLVLDARMNNSWAYGGGVGISRPGLGQRDIAQYTRDQFASDIQMAMGGYGANGRHVHLYLNGIYWGLYCIHERPDEHFAEEYFGGEAEDYDCLKHNSSTLLNGSRSTYLDMCNLASSANYVQAQQYLDIPDFIGYMITNYYIANTDWSHHNWYATHNGYDPAGRWRFHSWDAEHSVEGLYDDRTGRDDSRAPTGIHRDLIVNAEYKMLFADHVYRHFANDGTLSPEGAAELYQIRIDEIDRAVVGESARWGDNQRSTPFTRNTEWITERNWLLGTYLPQRTAIVLGQFKSRGWYPNIDPPVFKINGASQHGGYTTSTDSLTMTAGSGTIYYTLNGEDPRSPGGAVNTAHATAYSAAINLPHSTLVRARLKNGSTWSALNEATYAIGPVAENLRITEIMYNPMETGDPNDPNQEFIELHNIGDESINLNLVKFTKGIDFTFDSNYLAPGGFIVIVKDTAAFLTAHPDFDGVIAGEYYGKLDNGGEKIQVQDAARNTFFDFKYKDAWRSLTDGSGFSLTIIDPNDIGKEGRSEEGLVAHWKLDEDAGGIAPDSAGTNDGTIFGNPTLQFGQIDQSFFFDGTGDYVSLDPIEPLNGDTVTAEAWIKFGRFLGVWNPVLIQHDLAANGYYFYVFQNMPAFSVVDSTGVAEAKSANEIEMGRWYHIAGTNDGSNLRIYVDGELKDTAESTGMQGTSYEARIGCDISAPTYYQGSIDDVRIYDRALTDRDFQLSTDILARWGDKDSWRASAYVGGSPGEDDSGIVPNPGAVIISEIMAHSHGVEPDWLEMYNTTDDEIDIGGWYLSDSRFILKKYRFAEGTKIDAGAYKVLHQHLNFGDDSTDPNKLIGFAFSENNDKCYLSSGEGTSVTGYRTVESFGASYTGVSFGKYFKRSTGNYNFVPMDHNTPGAANAYPAVGPIVINEIMYNPDWPYGGTYGNDRYEFVELKNISDEPVALWRQDKSLPWKFSSGIDFVFPAAPGEVTLDPNECIVIVRDVDAFMWRYPAVPASKIFGPYLKSLDDAGEQLELSKPGDIDKFGRQYYIRVDRVTYSDGSHHDDAPGGVDLWPTAADAAGKSLNRVTPTLYSNDPNNWSAADPSPGG